MPKMQLAGESQEPWRCRTAGVWRRSHSETFFVGEVDGWEAGDLFEESVVVEGADGMAAA